ncbi:hypothetical protein [Halomonas sp. HG01]|uniref:hypothetical protein n=1 Tax=Halomonas sp. HG01 TaxID=1609967 RepID=UPI000B2ABB2C|nr:hypothetical protein [Halomonas sp. HG01]
MTEDAHQIALLAAEIRDDLQRAESAGRATIGLWALMSYAERLEKLAKKMEGREWSNQ